MGGITARAKVRYTMHPTREDKVRVSDLMGHKVIVGNDELDAFLRLPRAQRTEGISTRLTADGRAVAKSAHKYFSGRRDVEFPCALAQGTYNTCTPASHTRQVS